MLFYVGLVLLVSYIIVGMLTLWVLLLKALNTGKAVRAAKRNEEKVKAETLAKSFLNKKPDPFWSEIRKQTKSPKKSANNIEGISDNNGIAYLFAGKFDELYNSVGLNSNNMSLLIDKLDNKKA